MIEKLPKELLTKEYIINKLTSYEIASKYGCTATWISTLRKRHKIRIIRRYERNPKQNLLKKQREYICGSLLGDGSIQFGIAGNKRGNKNGFFSVSQICKPYIYFQYSVMMDFVNSEPSIYIDKRSDRKEMCRLRTISHPIFTNLYKEIYLCDIKTISSRWLQQLTPFSLAIWYMDDGSITKSHYQMRISTESFSFQEHLLLQEYFRKRWNIFVDIKPSPKEDKFVLLFRARERDKFFSLISQYIIPEMGYKISVGEKEWEKWTSFEIDYLRRNYFGRKTDWRKVLNNLNHSKCATLKKASYLGLATNNYSSK